MVIEEFRGRVGLDRWPQAPEDQLLLLSLAGYLLRHRVWVLARSHDEFSGE